MINRTFLAGNITADPQLRTTPGGTAILEFGLAVNERRRNQQTGEWEDRPNFFNMKIFNTRAEALSRILTKGMHVSVEGHLHWDSWEDKDTGQKRSKIEVIVDEIEFLSQRQQNGPQSAPQPAYAPQSQQRYANPRQPQMAPQMPSQAPTGYVAAPGVYQPAMPQAPQPQASQPQDDIYFDEPIPF